MSGDLKALENARELTKLELANAEVVGDIQALKHMRRMRVLRLSETKVIGDLMALKPSKLRCLRVAGTSILSRYLNKGFGTLL